MTEPEPLKMAESVFAKPANVPGAAWMPEPLASVQLVLPPPPQAPLLPFQTPLPEKTWTL